MPIPTIACALAPRGAPAFRDARMPSLHALLDAHSPLLAMDASSSNVQVGWLSRDAEPRWHASADEAGVAVFDGVEKLGRAPGDAAAFVFCEGPGSVLGIRTVAMAVRTWRMLKPRPVFSYQSLALVAHALGRNDLGVIADARRDMWHHFQIGRGLRRLSAAEASAATEEIVMPEGFRHWSAPSPNVARIPYPLGDLFTRAASADLFSETESLEAFMHEEPSYVTWTPRIHRQPGEG